MKKFMTSLLILGATICPFAPGAFADTTLEVKAYECRGDVVLLPTTQTTTLKVLNEGAVVHPGDTIVVTKDKSLTLPAAIEPGMLFAPTGAVLGTNAVFMDDGKVKIKTKDGKTIIKYDD